MRAIVVDDECLVLQNIMKTLGQVTRITETYPFSEPKEALAFLKDKGSDVAFLDVKMGEMDGLTLAKQVKEVCPSCFIIFVTGYSEYAVDAFKLRASGYLLKPVRQKDIETELDNIENLTPPCSRKRLRVQCFGNFEVFTDGVPVRFEKAKTREMFAYLIDRRGANVSVGELMAVLWEDKPKSLSLQTQLRKLSADLTASLKRVGAENILLKNRGSLAVLTDELDCDYYSYLKHESWGINQFSGEYMTNYGWAEMTLGYLYEKKASLPKKK